MAGVALTVAASMPQTLRSPVAAPALLIAAFLTVSSFASAQSVPDTDNGHYSLSQVPDGYLRLDTRTGVVSSCTNKGGWTCRVVPDERAALDTEIGRLQSENKKLRDQLAQRAGPQVKTETPATGGNADKKVAQDGSAGKTIELQLPFERAKIVALFDRMWQRLVELAGLIQKKLSEKI